VTGPVGGGDGAVSQNVSVNATEEALRLCRVELAQVQAALEAALETQAEDRRRREVAERQLAELSEVVDRRLSAGPRSALATRLRSRSPEAAQVELVRSSSLFDAVWYLSHHPHVVETGLSPAEHYVRLGAVEGLDPGPDFSTDDYLRGHPDVAKSRENPLVHYLSNL
jgi:hypothetical protein